MAVWPDPAESTGDHIKSRRQFAQEISFWKARGPAGDLRKTLVKKIIEYLYEDPDEEREQIPPLIYMTGRTPETAHPIIMFVSENRRERKRARKAIMRSGILKEYPAVTLGETDLPLDLDRLDPLALLVQPREDLPVSGAEARTTKINLSANMIFRKDSLWH